MAITWPTRAQMLDWFLSWHRIYLPNASTQQRADAWLEGQAVSGIAGVILARVQAIYAAIFITTAEGDDLDKHANDLLPSDRRRQPAAGTTSGECRFDGVNGTPIPLNTELVHADGTRYRTSEAISASDWPAPPLASVMVEVRSVDTGVIANKASADYLTLVTPISGIDDEVVVSAALDGARDKETDDELRARLLDWLQYPPGGGNWGHYLNYAQGVGGCEKAYVYPLYRGLGTVDVVCMGPGILEGSPTGDRFSADENLVWDELDEEMRPATADIGLRPSLGTSGVGDPKVDEEPIYLDISPAYGYEPDHVLSFTAITPCPSFTRIEVTADPSALAKGNRLLVNVNDGTFWIPTVVTVVSTVTGANHYIDIEETLGGLVIDVVPSGVQPAGPGTQEQIGAVLALFDGLTPGDTSPASRRPIVSPAEPTDLLLADIFDSVQSLDSVLNMVINAPAADTTPTAEKYLIRNERIYITYV